VLFLPNYFYNIDTPAATFTGNVANFSNALTTANRLTGCSQYRITSYGIRVRHISAPLYASGMVHVRGFSDKVGSGLTAVDMAGYNCDFSEDVPLQEAREIAVIGRRTDIKAASFQTLAGTTPSAAISTWDGPGWGAITVSVIGGPASTSVLQYEIFLNMEVTFLDNESLSLLTTPPPHASSLLTDATNTLYSEGKSVFLQGAKQAGAWVVNSAAKALAASLAMRVGGPAAARAAIMLD
jgi:hypothetical protein